MAREPKTLYSLTDAENVAVTDLVTTVDAAMLAWNPEDHSHTFALSVGVNIRVARALRKEYRGAGWDVELTDGQGEDAGKTILVFKDPNHAENVASLP